MFHRNNTDEGANHNTQESDANQTANPNLIKRLMESINFLKEVNDSQSVEIGELRKKALCQQEIISQLTEQNIKLHNTNTALRAKLADMNEPAEQKTTPRPH